MPITSVEDIWNLVCEECKKIITQVAFDCFIAGLKPVTFNNGELVIACKEEYERGIIEENYSEILKKAFNFAIMHHPFLHNIYIIPPSFLWCNSLIC